MSSNPAPIKKGFQPKRNPTIKLANPEILKSVRTPVPTSQIEPVSQSFYGIPKKEIFVGQERILVSALKNPIINPSVSLSRLAPKSVDTPLSRAPPKPKLTLKPVEGPPPEFIPRKPRVGQKMQQAFDTRLSPIFTQYQRDQTDGEEKNPYLTDTTIYMPQTRKSFYRFISDNYRPVFGLPVQITTKIDEDACRKLGEAAKDKVEAFLYQKFIREYIRQASPNRGVLVYHGLGSGKTCSAIAAAEALYGTANKKIIVMTPFSLRANFMSEISFCGMRHFSLQNHWVGQTVDNNVIMAFAKSVLSLSEPYLARLQKRKEEDRRVIWIADYTKPSNFEELSPQERDDVRAQITEMIENRIIFINYNGIQASKLKEYACTEDPVTKRRIFDDAVIVIDEIHNLTRLMQGTIVPYMVARPGKRRTIPAEPVEPGKWKPKLCGTSMNYKRAYLFYRILTNAKNSKIIGLSGTPIINFPEELGILANVLSGYIDCVETSIMTTNLQIVEEFMKIAIEEPRVDIVRKTEARGLYNILISIFPECYEKVRDNTTQEFEGVKYAPDSQEEIQEIWARIRAKAKDKKIPLSPSERFVSYPRLPPDEDAFRGNFITQNLDIKNEIVLKKRLTGLISYYKGSKEEYMPRVIRDEDVRCDMSDYVLSKYTIERSREITGEAKKKDEKGSADAFADVEAYAKMKNPSSYRFRSRALCNFAFPKSVDRPFPDSPDQEDSEVTIVEDLEMAEAQTNPDEDLQAQELVADEEEAIPDVEEEEQGEEEKEISETLIQQTEQVQKGGDSNNEASDSNTEVSNKNDMDKLMKKLENYKQEGQEEETKVLPTESVLPIKLRRRPQVAPMPLQEQKGILNTLSEGVEAVVDAVQGQTTVRRKTYQERVKEAMLKLNAQRNVFLNLDAKEPEAKLVYYSAKLDAMLRRIIASKGSNLVYSNFVTVEGLGVLGIALKANSFTEIQIEGSDLEPRFTAETEESLRKGPKTDKRFITFTGEGSRERRTLVLNIFNGNFSKLPKNMRDILVESGYEENGNKYGDICWIIGISGAGAEGISLKCVRSVHIMEPYWNKVRLDQVKGRAIRICSHSDLPYKDREVEIYTYYTAFSEEQKSGNKIDMTIRTSDENETSDQKVLNVSIRKDKINQALLTLMKEVAVDCELNGPDNGQISCFQIDGKPDQFIFDPELQTDIINTNIELTEDKKVMNSIKNPQQSIAKETGQPATAKTQTIDVPVIEWEEVQYMLGEKQGSGGLIYYLYEMNDIRQRKPVGEIQKDPITDDFDEPKLWK